MLSKEQSGSGKATSSTPVQKVTTPASKDAATAGPNRQRRRPRKLNKEPAPANSAPTPATTSAPVPAASKPELPPASTLELEALKSRVRGLEAKVEELYHTGADRSARSPRRRGKARKGSSGTQVPTLSRASTADAGAIEDEEEEADEELVRLQGELEIARQDLASYAPRRTRRARASAPDGDDDVEEIPRDFDAGSSTDKGNRQVTLTGNYRIPLPASVSMEDVKSIQSGVSAAQNVAKNFLEQRRAQGRLDQKSASPVQKKGAEGEGESKEGGKSWAEWVGGYSVAISKAVRNIEAEAALETKRAAKGKGTRPPLKARAGNNLSSEQVQGLMK